MQSMTSHLNASLPVVFLSDDVSHKFKKLFSMFGVNLQLLSVLSRLYVQSVPQKPKITAVLMGNCKVRIL